MIETSITPQHVVDVLNRAAKADPTALHKLIETRVPCNDVLAEDPTIQVSAYDEKTGKPTPGAFRVGLLGLLNGLFGTDDRGWGCIAGVFEELCPGGCQVLKGVVVGDTCSVCGEHKIECGPLSGFQILEESMPEAQLAREERAKDEAAEQGG